MTENYFIHKEKISLLVFWGLFFISQLSVTAQLNVEYGIIELFNETNNISITPGEDIVSEFESSHEIIKISVNFLPENMQNDVHRSWYINIKKSDIEWDSNLEINIRRTNNGEHIYNNYLSGGEDYLSINNYDNHFIEGNGKILNINCQIKLVGRSLIIPAKQYQTNIVFTLIDD